MPSLQEFEMDVSGGYYPSCSVLPPAELQNTIRAGRNTWLRPLSKLQVANGVSQISVQNVGARIFQANTQRAAIAGGLVGGTRLPYAGLTRYQNAALFYLSELTGQQVYLDESAVSGLTTSGVAGRLRVAIPDGGGGYNVYDSGFDPPVLPGGNVSVGSGGTKSMSGSTGVALAAWRTSTNAISAPSNIVYQTCTPSSADLFTITLPSAASGQDGWIFAGTRWGDQTGEVRVVRYVYITPRGTFTATNGSPNLLGDDNTRWLRDLRVGDVIDISGTSYTVSTITDDKTAALTTNFSGSTNTYTATMVDVVADWYNSELGALLDRDVIKPPSAAGILSYAGRVFLWGTDGESGNTTGQAIRPLLASNPEHVGLTVIVTEGGEDILNALAGDRGLFLMTPNTLQTVTFTNQTNAPFVVRVLHQPGFKTPTCGAIYKDRFYGFSGKPLRSIADDNMDVEFGAAVFSDMQSWDDSKVVVAIDPINEAVLYCQRDSGGGTTTIIPYMAQLGRWGIPHTITGQVIDFTVVNGICYLILLVGANYRVYQWEGGAGVSDAYVATQFQDAGSQSDRKVIKRFVFTGKASTLRAYVIRPGAAPPDLTSTGAAAATHTLSGSDVSEAMTRTHIGNARALAVRLDFPAGGSWDRLSTKGYGLKAER